MKHLSSLDATFLHVETPEMPMHVGGLNLFDLPPGYQGDFYQDVKAHVASRMHLASVFTKKLALMPFELTNPVWIDDDAVDLDYHVRHIHLPKPGSMAQLEAYVGRLHSSLLDRSRPLWEFYVFDGLETGQAAFYSKIHHAALDGQGAAVMAQALLDISPIPREVPPPKLRRKGPYHPKVGDLMSAALKDTVSQCWRLVKGIPTGVKAVSDLVRSTLQDSNAAKGSKLAKSDDWGLAPKTPLNVSITNQRVFSSAQIPLQEAKLIGKVFEASLNDVVLATCSGALREWLASKGALPSKTLTAAVPVSLREQGDTELNNQVSLMRMQLASNFADPVKRIQTITKNSAALKRTLKSVKSVLPTDFPSLGLPWIMTGLVSLYGRTRLADKITPLANVVISNVPGPQVPLYLAGAKMVTNFPVSIVVHGLALNITVQSYAGALDFGLIACRRAMPDIQDFAQMMLHAHQELLAAAKDKMKLEQAAEPEFGNTKLEAAQPAKAKAVKKSGVKKSAATALAADGAKKKPKARASAKKVSAAPLMESDAVSETVAAVAKEAEVEKPKRARKATAKPEPQESSAPTAVAE